MIPPRFEQKGHIILDLSNNYRFQCLNMPRRQCLNDLDTLLYSPPPGYPEEKSDQRHIGRMFLLFGNNEDVTIVSMNFRGKLFRCCCDKYTIGQFQILSGLQITNICISTLHNLPATSITQKESFFSSLETVSITSH